MKTLLAFAIVFLTHYSNAQIEKHVLDSICEEVEEVLGEDWFLVQKESGFEVFFCRSCQENYSHSDHSGKRYDFFSVDKIDSVSYFPTVSTEVISPNLSDTERKQKLREVYSANDILSFEVILAPVWDKISKIED